MVRIAIPNEITVREGSENELRDNEEFLPSYVWNTNGWICDYLGLTVTEQIQKCIPKIAHTHVYSQTLGRVILKGQVIGMGAVATTKTKEDITKSDDDAGNDRSM